MATKQISIRVSEKVYEELSKIAGIADIDVSKLARYFTYRSLEEFRKDGVSVSFEIGFWNNPAAWVRFKDSIQDMKVFPFEGTPEGNVIMQEEIQHYFKAQEEMVNELNAEK